MGRSLYESFSECRAVFDEVSEAVELDLKQICFDLAEEELRATQNAQLALFTCGVAAWSALGARLASKPALFAGHSIGEYAAVVSAGAVSLADGARLVARRGELMSQAPKGTMAAVLGLDREVLVEVCLGVGPDVVVANDNCPGQLVISGSVESVQVASERAAAAGAKRVLPLNVSGAFHSPLMESASVQMREALDAAGWLTQHTPVVANVTTEAVTSGWPNLLSQQLQSSVRWTESVQAMLANGVTTFVECGSGEVLTGLLRRIDKEARGFAVHDKETLELAVGTLTGEPS